MPLLVSQQRDEEGMRLIREWIRSMAAPADRPDRGH
jgi:hypothetical protein